MSVWVCVMCVCVCVLVCVCDVCVMCVCLCVCDVYACMHIGVCHTHSGRYQVVDDCLHNSLDPPLYLLAHILPTGIYRLIL